MKELKLIIAGEGGQGIQTIADTFAMAADHEGDNATYIPNFGVEQRGGVSLAFVQISEIRPIGFPKFEKADILVLLCERAIERTRQYITSNTILIYDSDLINSKKLPTQIKVCADSGRVCANPHLICDFNKIFAIPATSTAREKFSPRVFNVIILGVILAIAHIVKLKEVERALNIELADKFKKNPHLKNLNQEALEFGVDLVREKFARQLRCVKYYHLERF